ncbi:MAG: gliding motility-associated C-terminal domain-containing protein [Lewinellaceae bacterium]|nr:gliding motility-associated C-terminal domain-containing protein [Lewinellaceae bacterium]
MKSTFLIIPFSFLLSVTALQAQLPVACGGGSQPAISCATVCISCNFAGYNGSTAGYPSGIVPNFCGTVENAQWLGFIAGAPNATFTITPSNCSDGNGLQVALYEDCMGTPLACDKGEADGGSLPVSISIPMTQGDNYYLMIDGYAGDLCEFTVSVDPPDAVFEPPLGVVSQVDGPVKVCPGASLSYAVQPVSGASVYIWDGPPGTLVDSMPVPATAGQQVQVTWGAQGGSLCVQAANSCSVNPPCSATLQVEMLTDADRPQIKGDTTVGLSCYGTPIFLEPVVTPPFPYVYQWAADSLGELVSGANSVKPLVSSIGNYQLLVTNTANGCTATQYFEVGPPELPVPTGLELRDVRCFGESNGGIKVLDIAAGVPPYLFAVDDGPLLQTPEFQYLEAGSHAFKVQDSYGCEWDTLLMLEQPDDWLLQLAPDTTIHLGQTLDLWQMPWVSDPGRVAQTSIRPTELAGWLCATCQFCPTHSFRYHVTVRDAAGCTTTDSREVIVDKTRQVYIPNVFQPDNFSDGNERFQVFCGEDVAQVLLVQLYNRWGQLVFERNDFAPNDASAAWDGRFNNEKLLPGVLLYFVEVQFKDGETEQYRGDVTLLR